MASHLVPPSPQSKTSHTTTGRTSQWAPSSMCMAVRCCCMSATSLPRCAGRGMREGGLGRSCRWWTWTACICMFIFLCRPQQAPTSAMRVKMKKHRHAGRVGYVDYVAGYDNDRPVATAAVAAACLSAMLIIISHADLVAGS